MKKTKKVLAITASVILSLALVSVIALAAYYLYAETVIFDHKNCSTVISDVDPAKENIEGYSLNYPFFGNPTALNGTAGRTYSLTFFSGGEKNICIYDAVNDPIYIWVEYLYNKYRGRVNLDYTLEQDSKTISVSMSGNLNDGEKTVFVEQKFVFDIENAAPDHLPVWANGDEISDEFREYIDYVNNPCDDTVPDWVKQRME